MVERLYNIFVTFFSIFISKVCFLYQISMYKKMDYFCDVCGKTIKINSYKNHLQSPTHTDFEKCIRTKHTIQNPDYFDIDEKITNLSLTTKNLDLYPVNFDFELIFVKKFSQEVKLNYKVTQQSFV